VCFAASEGCAEVATKYYGVPASKVAVCPLGSDTEVFHPAYDEASLEKRRRRRSSLGYGEGDIVCIYTGRFTDEKDPFCLAKAIAQLRADGERFVGLFLGDGPQAKRIAKQPGCSVLPFVPWNQLADYYRSADIGVWPAQESMSMIDAAACALPVVASDRMGAMERIAGNGLTYKQADAADLAKVLFTMRDSALRSRLGEAGHMKVRREYSWTRVAEIRANAYERAVC
jgi:glycosyltransferase involved in cell wall biosynthesis